MATDIDCFVCQKHRGEVVLPGGLVYEDDLVAASHGVIQEGESDAVLGVLFVEPRRHVPGMAELSTDEAERIGLVLQRLSAALQASEGAERVYVSVLGHHVAHLHVWLVPRYPGTPEDVIGMHVLRWNDAPRGGPAEIASLAQRVRAHLAANA